MTTEKRIPLHILEDITNGFSADSIIGTGGYGNVYKGVYNRREIAVKLLHVDTVRGLDDHQFKNEVGNLLRVQHQNIVQLVGYCYETKKIYVERNGRNDFSEHIYKVLCFEYLEGGSLDKHLCGQSFPPNWTTCYNIIKGVCEGLNFLHKCEPQILHLDLKPANILLDSYMEPKVADFGLSRLFTQSHAHVTQTIIGSRKYMPPEFINEGKILPKNDIFSFGVVMIEIMASSVCSSSSLEKHDVAQFKQEVLTNWSTKIEATSKYPLEEIHQVQTCIELAIRCVDSERDNRPSTEDILDALNKTEANIPRRKRCPQISVPRLKMAKKRKKTAGHLKGVIKERTCFTVMQENIPSLLEIGDHRETSAKIGAEVVGREIEKQEIMNRLSAGSTTHGITFFPIYGIGGIGKTTMAQFVFSDFQFKEYSRVWIYVSQMFDLKKIGNSIITQLSGKESEHTDLQMIETSLQNHLSRKRVLIILDDLWERQSAQLKRLESMLKLGEKARVIVIVTTREESIAQRIHTDTVKPYKLAPLIDDICWTVIKNKCSFESRSEKAQLELIGKEIAKKCGGLALAAQSIGYMLGSMEFDEWVSVNNSEIWDVLASGEYSPDHVHASLLLSYHSMDKYLKLCFAYCATIPKGQEIAKEDLAHQWIALGLVEPSRTFSNIQTSHKYISQLLGMSFLEHSRSKRTIDDTLLIMHDLVHDLGRSVLADKINIESPACRYAWLTDHGNQFQSSMNPLAKIRAMHLHNRGYLQFHNEAFSLAKFLCVLDLSRCCAQELPDSIGQLKKLRYLDVSWSFKELGFAPPESILIPQALGSLTELQYLNLSSRVRPIGLPEVISKLTELQYLNISGCMGYYLLDNPSANQSFIDCIGTLPNLEHLDMSLNEYDFCVPESFSSLKKLNLSGCEHIASLPENLAKLDISRLFGLLDNPKGKKGFHVHAVNGESSSSLVWLKHINPDSLDIVSLQNVKSVKEACTIRLIEKKRIENLSFQWGSRVSSTKHLELLKEEIRFFSNSGVSYVEQMELLTELVPPSSVKSLQILGYKDVILPHWFMHISKYVPNLVSLEMCVFPCSCIPTLIQLPNLRKVVLGCSEEFFNTGVDLDAANELWSVKLEYLRIDCVSSISSIPRAHYLYRSGGKTVPSSRSSTLRISDSRWPLHRWRFRQLLGGLSDLTITNCIDLTISPQTTRVFTSLKSLSLVIAHEKLPEWLGELTSLRHLCLNMYYLQELHESMRQLTHLQSLTLVGCSTLTSLPQWFGEHTLLKTLKIISCEGMISLPGSILTNLQELNISNSPKLCEWCKLEDNQMKLAHMQGEGLPIWTLKAFEDGASGSRVNSKDKKQMDMTDDRENIAASIHGTMIVDVAHPDPLYSAVMNMPGFTEESLFVALSHLMDSNALGSKYMGMHEEDRASWLMNFLRMHY